jgi:hypothetical protein
MQRRFSFVPLLLGAAAMAQVPADLRNWTPEHQVAGAGNWVVALDGSSVNQTLNGWPTLFYSDFDVQGLRIEGGILIAGSDDDYVGFVLGFQPGGWTDPNADFLLVDWKGASQTYNWGSPSCTPGTTAYRGLAVSRVEGLATADELWGHVNLDTAPCSGPTDRVTELQRAANLGATGWARNRTYQFRFDYTPTRLQVFVDNVLELDVSGTFPNGRMGFYNFSQSNVTYSAFQTNLLASWSIYGTGHPGTLGVPSLQPTALPVLGTTIGIDMTSASPVPAFAVLGYGWAADSVPSGYGGRILVQVAFVQGFVLPVPPLVGSAPLSIPLDQSLAGIHVYCQFAHFDAGASHELAFSPGLLLNLGN